MMNKQYILLGLLGAIGLTLLKLILTPVPQPIPANCAPQSGIVQDIFSPCCQDVMFKLENDQHRYYINRGFDKNEINIDQFRKRLIGKEVQLQVIQCSWTPLDPENMLMPVAQIESGGEVVFSRMIAEDL